MLGFAACAAASPAATLIPTNAVWRYLDDGSDQGTAWRQPAFNDSAWANGMAHLGFGDGDEITIISRLGTNGQASITFYFRHSFVVGDPSGFSGLQVRLRRDDGGWFT